MRVLVIVSFCLTLLSGCCAAGLAATAAIADNLTDKGAPSRVLSGSVVDAAGNPIPGAVVTLQAETFEPLPADETAAAASAVAAEGVYTGVSDTKGEFKIAFGWFRYRHYTLSANAVIDRNSPATPNDPADDTFYFGSRTLGQLNLVDTKVKPLTLAERSSS